MSVKELVKDIIIVVIIVAAVTFFIKPIIVKQTSMLPNLQENNYLFLNRQAYRFGEPKRGDVVVFPVDDGYGDEELYIKRVIGLPGETIDVYNGKVYVNGEIQDDSYTNDQTTPGDIHGFVVPEGELFVMGDNRVVSIDSRDPDVGTVPIDEITGVAFFRMYPFNEIGKI